MLTRAGVNSVCLLCAVVILTSCAHDGYEGGVRDSAGVRIVENAAPLWTGGDALRLTSEPQLLIGTQEGKEYQFARIVGALRLSDGRIVVGEAGASGELRFFDGAGQFLLSAGRAGQGPGEFRSMYRIAYAPGDTIIAIGFDNDELIFNSEGEYVRNTDSMPRFPTLPPGQQGVIAHFGTQPVVVGSFPLPRIEGPVGTRWLHYFTLAFANEDSASSRLIGEFPQMFVMQREHALPQPWFTPYFLVTNNDSVFFIGFGTEYSIRAYSTSGELKSIIRRHWIPERVTSADVDRLVAIKRVEWASNAGEFLEGWLDYLRTEQKADSVSAFSTLLADRAGRLWVRETRLIDEMLRGNRPISQLIPQEGSRWSVFDAAGTWLSDIDMPPQFVPLDIGADYVLGISFTADGVETVAMYGLVGGPPGGG